MKSVIAISDEPAEVSSELISILQNAGIAVWTRRLNSSEIDSEPTNNDPTTVVAVVYEVPLGLSGQSLRQVTRAARALWPSIPLIACITPGLHRWNALGQAVMRASFSAIADSAAQLPAVLREVEERSESGDLPRPFKRLPEQPTFALPGSLGNQQLRGAFTLIASLHGATCQDEAASFAISGLGRLVSAHRWAIYVARPNRADPVRLTSVLAREFLPGNCLSFDREWERELLESAVLADALAGKTAQEAAARMTAVRRSEKGVRTVAVPLFSGDRVIGVVEGSRRGPNSRAFSRADVAMLTAVTPAIAMALANSVRIAEAERLSSTDELTRLHNARYLRQFLVNEIKRARRYRTKVSALFLDLDDFKHVNDLHGHLVGSHCLMEIAALLLPSVRDTDCLVRYGGDEFVVILPEAGAEDAALVAHRIRAKIEGHRFTGGRRLRISFTASIGVAVFPDNAPSPRQLISCADQAMYAAKAANKNCIRLAATSDPVQAGAELRGLTQSDNQFQRIPDDRLIS
ncbi:MAG: diguanylate cyclase [Pyrinomonadaceae bacterium]